MKQSLVHLKNTFDHTVQKRPLLAHVVVTDVFILVDITSEGGKTQKHDACDFWGD